MAKLFRVRVLAAEGRSIELELISLIVEAGPPDPTKTFALNLVVELFWRLSTLDHALEEGPVAEAKVAAGVPEVAEQMRGFRALSVGVDHEVSAEAFALARRERRYAGRAVRSAGKTRGGYTVSVEGDGEAFTAAADRAVDAVSIGAVHNADAFTRWPDADYSPEEWTALHADPDALAAYRARLPRARLRIDLAASTHHAFVMPGQVWESTVHR